MLKFIALLVFVFLALLGFSDVIYSISSLILKPKKKAVRILNVLLDKDFAETQVISEIFNLRWFGEKFADKIVFLTNNLEEKDILMLENEYKSEFVEFKNGVINGREQKGNV